MNEKCVKYCCRCPKLGTCEHSQDVLFKKLFSQYGYYREDTSNKKIGIYEQHPEHLHTENEILRYFERSQEDIDELQETILQLKAYQTELTRRYNFIKTSPVKKKIVLKRQQRWHENVFYYIFFYDVNLNDGHEEQTKCIKYAGKDRKKAFDMFKQLKSSNPGADFTEDIKI